MKLASMIVLAAGIALAPGFAGAEQTHKQVKRQHTVRPAQPEHIACTKYGCYPIPANCTPHRQFDWWGNPTGYDAIACR